MNRKADTDAAGGVKPFTERWEGSGAAERANYQLFLSELSAPLDAPAIAQYFTRAPPRAEISDLLETLAALGHIHPLRPQPLRIQPVNQLNTLCPLV